jgi:hypothetical protein
MKTAEIKTEKILMQFKKSEFEQHCRTIEGRKRDVDFVITEYKKLNLPALNSNEELVELITDPEAFYLKSISGGVMPKFLGMTINVKKALEIIEGTPEGFQEFVALCFRFRQMVLPYVGYFIIKGNVAIVNQKMLDDDQENYREYAETPEETELFALVEKISIEANKLYSSFNLHGLSIDNIISFNGGTFEVSTHFIKSHAINKK